MSGFWKKGMPLDVDGLRSAVDPLADGVVEAIYARHQDAGVAALLESLGRSSVSLQQRPARSRGLLLQTPYPLVGGHELNLDWLHEGERPFSAAAPAGLLATRDVAPQQAFADRLRARLTAEYANEGGPPLWATRLCDYFDSTSQLPTWAKEARIKRASDIALFYGLFDTLILCCGSLPWCYLDSKGVPVLASTQRLEGKRVYRRIWETSHFVVHAAEPGGLGPDGKGIFFAQRVRLLHAAVRNRLLAARPPEGWPANVTATATAMHETGDTTDWSQLGQPLNQEDMAYVLLTFSYIGIAGLRKLGANPSAEDADAYIHLWNVVGHVLGIPPELMADTFEDAEALFELLLARVRQESDKGKLLMKSLLTWLEEVAPGHMHDVPTIIVAHLLGPENVRLLGIELGARHTLRAPITIGALRLLTRLGEWGNREAGNQIAGAIRKTVYTAIIGTLWDRRRNQWTDLARWPDVSSGNEDATPVPVAMT